MKSTHLPLELSFKAEVLFKSFQNVLSNTDGSSDHNDDEEVSRVAGTCALFTSRRLCCLVGCGVSMLLGVLSEGVATASQQCLASSNHCSQCLGWSGVTG